MILLNKSPQQPANTFDFVVKRGKQTDAHADIWLEVDYKTPAAELPAACKVELKKTFQKVGCNNYNPITVELVFEKIQEGKQLKEIIFALRSRDGCSEANVRWIHAAIKRGYKNMYMQNAPPLPKKSTPKPLTWV